jgi:small conductance mechanosensitive channel
MSNTSILALLSGLALFVGISLFVSLIIIRVLSKTAAQSQLSRNSIRDEQRSILIIWLVLVVIWILQTLGFTSLLSSLTLSGIIGLGITLALQSTLSNLLSGFWLLHDNVLRLGDNIEMGNIKGTVIKLSFRSTWLKNSEGDIVIMSNSTLYSGPFTNLTATERLSRKSENENKVL